MENIKNWYNRQLTEIEFYRVGLIAFILLVHSCIMIPVTLRIIGIAQANAIEYVVMGILAFTVVESLIAKPSSGQVILIFLVSAMIHLFIIWLHL